MSERPFTTGPSPVHGTGVFATATIEPGALIGEFEGEPTDVNGTHVLWVIDDDGTEQGFRGTGKLRWLNHSRTPNAAFDGLELRARSPIAPGDEILIHYGDEWADVP